MPNIYFQSLSPDTLEYSKKPVPAYLSTPDYWKAMPKYKKNVNPDDFLGIKDMGTIRSCPAVGDAINYGYIMHTPCDIYIDASDPEKIIWDFKINPLQYDLPLHEWVNPDIMLHKVDHGYHKVALKINALFAVKTDPGYSCYFTSPVGSVYPIFKIFDSIVDTDTFIADQPYPVMVKENFVGIVPAGTPFIHVIPFKREEFKSQIIDYEYEEARKQKLMLRTFFTQGYKKVFWNRKKTR